MAFREVAVTEICEVLRAWLAGAGLRTAAARAGVDRKTARRYVTAAVESGLARDGGEGQLTDELIGQVAQVVRPVRPGGHGQAWEQLEACHAEIGAWVEQGLTVVKIGCCWSGAGSWSRTGRCTGSAPSAAVMAAPRRQRCGSLTVSPGPSASWTSVTWACWLIR